MKTARPTAEMRKAALPPVRLETIVDPGMLHKAWRRVRSNNGQPGGDRVTIAQFGMRLACEIEHLRRSMLDGSYRPRKLARYEQPKPSGGLRRLAIPSVRDRVAQTAALMALVPAIDAHMSQASWAYRPARGVDGALSAARAAAHSGRMWVVDGDIECFFDRVCHRRLMQDLSYWIDDERILRVCALWLGGFSSGARGIAQGSPISPFFANLYLHPIDRLVNAAGFEMVRYADDFLVMTRNSVEARRALELVSGLLSARGLSLNGGKTRIACVDAPVMFLGEPLITPAARG